MTFLLIAAVAALAAQSGHADHDHAAQAGRAEFPTSCSPAAQMPFDDAVAWLHSFEYEEAARRFVLAGQADPGCAMSQWGVAMTSYHPLWAPPTATELEQGRGAIARARAIGGRSPREQGYIAALDLFYRDSERIDHRTRALAYADAMGELHRRFPADDEAAIFYALALVATGTLDDDPGYARERAAAAILNDVLARRPDHPGVTHYLIHSFDYPALASLALPAARRYAGIAPASAHAQHMPSHIFIRLGLWDDAIRSNLAAEDAARRQAAARGLAGAWDQQLHAMDYLVYAYLQSAQDEAARQVLDELGRIARVDPATPTAAYAATAIPARYLLERRRWREAAALSAPATAAPLTASFPWAEAHIELARAVGAARSGDAATAGTAVAHLAEIERAMIVRAGEYDWRRQVEIQRRIASAWLDAAEGRRDEALSAMRSAAELDDATEKHPVTPGAVLPAREQLGELLLELGRPAEALAEFEAALRRAPRRFAAVHGAARAAAAAGDDATARRHYAELIEIAHRGGARPEVEQARAYLERREVAGPSG